eukprot:SAG11_NODE_3519_length_2396_cov_2.077057_1_plen_145_part_00
MWLASGSDATSYADGDFAYGVDAARSRQDRKHGAHSTGARERLRCSARLCPHVRICSALTAILRYAKLADINRCDFNWTALHAATESNQIEAVRVLLENGANPNVMRTTDGMTPIHLAVRLQPHSLSTEQCPSRMRSHRAQLKA